MSRREEALDRQANVQRKAGKRPLERLSYKQRCDRSDERAEQLSSSEMIERLSPPPYEYEVGTGGEEFRHLQELRRMTAERIRDERSIVFDLLDELGDGTSFASRYMLHSILESTGVLDHSLPRATADALEYKGRTLYKRSRRPIEANRAGDPTGDEQAHAGTVASVRALRYLRAARYLRNQQQ